MPCCFRQEDFSSFPIEAYVKHMTPGAYPILALEVLFEQI